MDEETLQVLKQIDTALEQGIEDMPALFDLAVGELRRVCYNQLAMMDEIEDLGWKVAELEADNLSLRDTVQWLEEGFRRV